jgi:hypothetical protein
MAHGLVDEFANSSLSIKSMHINTRLYTNLQKNQTIKLQQQII